MKLTLTIFIMIFLSSNLIFGQIKTSNDTIYLNANFTKIENFKEVYLDNFIFLNATFDLNFSFQPEAKYETYTNHNDSGFLNGKVKAVHEFFKSKSKGKKTLKSITLYNKDGLKTEIHEKGGTTNDIRTFYDYDSEKRLIKSIRIVGKDTINTVNYKYNSKNQIIEYELKNNVYTLNFDELNRPIEIKKPNIYKLHYDKNIVKIDEYSTRDNKLIASKIYTYSENMKLIKEVSLNNLAYNNDYPMDYQTFYSYNSTGKLIRMVVFLNKNFNREVKFKYNAYNDLIKATTTWRNNHIDYQTNSYDYDDNHNKIYAHEVSDISKTNFETFYEIIYY